MDRNCINCHTFCKNKSEKMLFHVRERYAGTVFWNNKELTKINTKTENTISSGVYPSWHPDGRHVAFSANHIVQTFHSLPEKRVEVIDTLSDILIYDTEKNFVFSNSDISSSHYLETFPEWSSDGQTLFFCRAKALPPDKYADIRYELCKINFSPESQTFGGIDIILNFEDEKKSITFPKVSPDGKFLLFCKVDYGNFSIWHNESDLYYINLETNEIKEAKQLNSNQSESYHSWSSCGNWIVYSSRKQDGLYTHSYISFFDSNGNFSKPFILPQKNPDFYLKSLKSYNKPEFLISKLILPRINLAEFILSNNIIQAQIDSTKSF